MEDPTILELRRIAKQISEFNTQKARYTLPDDLDVLSTALRHAIALRYADAAAMVAAGLTLDRPKGMNPCAHYLVVTAPQEDGWGTVPFAVHVSVRSDTPSIEVALAPERRQSDLADPFGTQVVESTFGVSMADAIQSSVGFADSIIADLLGHDDHTTQVWWRDQQEQMDD